jgi:hypothetical protein
LNKSFKIFAFTSKTIDGDIKDVPEVQYFQCDKVRPIGNQVVREYDGNECIRAVKVFLVAYGGHIFGREGFTEMADFVRELNNVCNPSAKCVVKINGCAVKVNGCFIYLN